ncbi:hypothetical protein GCM10023320_02280 [Pseudonocardia adelaidensis]|uniref:Uncharacterized protein n=1 Tax=Pseudonocardia adelaidensis TaxID=648754 RepID=A0ABP9N7T1_9PSEU
MKAALIGNTNRRSRDRSSANSGLACTHSWSVCSSLTGTVPNQLSRCLPARCNDRGTNRFRGRDLQDRISGTMGSAVSDGADPTG